MPRSIQATEQGPAFVIALRLVACDSWQVLENIKASGIEQMRIFVLGTRLFMYCEVPDDFDPSGDFNKNANR